MKKTLKVLAVLLAMGLCFLAGWRVMPKIWPAIKEHVVYAVFPQLEPEPAPAPDPYVPESSGDWGDPIAESDSLIYYFYKDYCPYCVQLEPLMAGLPQQITLPDGTRSNVRLVCLNKNDPVFEAVILEYYEENDIAEERQYVPAVVIGDRYLMPGREIIDNLTDALIAGEGLDTPVLDGAGRQP